MEKPHSSHAQLVEVYRAKNVLESHMLRSALEDEGIRAVVEGDMLQIAMGENPMGWMTAPRIMVCAFDTARAQAILQRFEARQGPQ